MNLFDLVCSITIDSDGFESGIQKAAKSFQSLNSGAGTVSRAIDSLDSAFGQIDSSASKTGSAINRLGDDAKQTGTSLRDVFTGGLLSGAIQSIASGISGVIDRTSEFRKIMGTLATSSQQAGYSAEQTSASYQQLYSVIGDDQQSATALANLQALGVSQEQLTRRSLQ